jgi:RNA polymerase sigma-70 factor (ECF subfamily)
VNWDKAYKEHSNLVRQICFEYEKNPDKLDELTQEVWLRVVDKQEQFNGDSEFGTWLYKIAHSVCKNYLRSETNGLEDISYQELEAAVLETELAENSFEMEALELATTDAFGTPEEWAIAEETAEILELSDKADSIQQFILYLYSVEGLTTKEIAKNLNMDESTVRSHLQSARVAVRRKLKE